MLENARTTSADGDGTMIWWVFVINYKVWTAGPQARTLTVHKVWDKQARQLHATGNQLKCEK